MRSFRSPRVARRWPIAVALAGAVVAGGSGPILGSTTSGRGADFNGDGFDDLAVGMPGDTLVRGGRRLVGAGSVLVAYGRDPAPIWSNARPWGDLEGWSRESVGVAGRAGSGDRFGWSLAAGDLDGDGFDDLAIGVPGATGEDGVARVGGVSVLFGSAEGLVARPEQPFLTTWTPEPGAAIGTAVATVSGWEETPLILAGAPGDPASHRDGRPRGSMSTFLLAADPVADVRVLEPGSQFTCGTQVGARLGTSIAVGQLDDDPQPEIAIGAPGQRTRGREAEGVGAICLIDVQPPREGGWGRGGERRWYQSLLSFGGAAVRPLAGDRLGTSVAFADPDGDGIDALLAGMPGRDVDGVTDAGAILVLPAHHGDPLVALDQAAVLTRADVDPGDAPQAGQRLGEVVLVADAVPFWPGDELVLGMPSTTVRGRVGAGEVLVARLPTDEQRSLALTWSAASTGIDGPGATAGDRFGQAVAVLDLDADGNPELAIATPGYGVEGGALNVLGGTPTGPVVSDSHWLRRGWAPGGGGTREAGDRLGWSLR